MEDARELSQTWGKDPVHPATPAYKRIVEGILQDLAIPEARYTNPPPPKGTVPPAKKQRLDLSLEREAWMRGCMAALPRRDSKLKPYSGTARSGNVRGATSRGRGGNHRGTHFRGGNTSGRFSQQQLRGKKPF